MNRRGQRDQGPTRQARRRQKYVLAAIDGTLSNSAAYRGQSGENLSYVRQFFRSFDNGGGASEFWHGPESEGGATGWDAYSIFTEVFDWLWRHMWEMPDAKIVLVGHSRGGHIAANVARRLRVLPADFFYRSAIWRARAAVTSAAYGALDQPGVMIDPITGLAEAIDHRLYDGVPVQFMGLYDAVDMTTSLGNTAVVPKNVRYCYHAIRSPELGSRRLWGNTATGRESVNDTHLEIQSFEATHGSVGGAVPGGCGTTTWGESAQYLLSTLPEDTCLMDITAEDNFAAGERANNFILTGARRAGLILR